MIVITLQLPDELITHLQRESKRCGYNDVSSYVQELIEEDRLRTRERELEQSLLESLDEPSTPLADKDFEEVQREGDANIGRRRLDR